MNVGLRFDPSFWIGFYSNGNLLMVFCSFLFIYFTPLQTLLLLGLFIDKLTLASEAHKHKGCFSAEELEDGALKILRRNRYLKDGHIDETQYHKLGTKKTCPAVLHSQSVDYNNRSVSPWRYR